MDTNFDKPTSPRDPGVFITGTDTGVGKTYVAARLARTLTRRGIRVEARKPVESGCEDRGGEPWPSDARELQEACGGDIHLDEICRWRLRHPLSPERAARLEGIPLTRAALTGACQAHHGGFVLVEGAGGFYSPLARDALNADLCSDLGLPVVIVVPDRLGCLNHTLLTSEMVLRRGLVTRAIVLNQIERERPAGMDNRQDLEARVDCPVIELPYNAEFDTPALQDLVALILRARDDG